MEKQSLKIQEIKPITHDVYRVQLEKPTGLSFESGQAADISINKKGWEDKMRAFTFTSLPSDDFIEFTIKTYPERKGVTNEIRSLKKGDELLIHGTFGAIKYKGKGMFLAGGAGLTPFISIFKNLQKQNKIEGNKLIFANKTSDDIIDQEYFNQVLGAHFVNVLSVEKNEKYLHGYIDEQIIKNNIANKDEFFYICGSDPMVDAMVKHLENLGIDKSKIVKEEF